MKQAAIRVRTKWTPMLPQFLKRQRGHFAPKGIFGENEKILEESIRKAVTCIRSW